ncbi:hypothetical protein [Alistipes putredinis]|nr:hypothetical protein [Alistipes putredinis]
MIQRYSQSKAMSGERNRKDRSEGDETIQPPYDMCRPEEQAQNLRQ